MKYSLYPSTTPLGWLGWLQVTVTEVARSLASSAPPATWLVAAPRCRRENSLKLARSLVKKLQKCNLASYKTIYAHLFCFFNRLNNFVRVLTISPRNCGLRPK